MNAHGASVESLTALQDLAELYIEAEYSHHSPAPDDDARAWSEAGKVRASLLVGVGPRERARRLVRSASREPA